MEQSQTMERASVYQPKDDLDKPVPGKLLPHFEEIRPIDAETQLQLAASCSQLVHKTNVRSTANATVGVNPRPFKPIVARRRPACRPGSIRSVRSARSQHRRANSRQRNSNYPADVRPKNRASMNKPLPPLPGAVENVKPRKSRVPKLPPLKTSMSSTESSEKESKPRRKSGGLHILSNAVAGYIRPRSPSSSPRSASASPSVRTSTTPSREEAKKSKEMERTMSLKRSISQKFKDKEHKSLSDVGKAMVNYVKPPQVEQDDDTKPPQTASSAGRSESVEVKDTEKPKKRSEAAEKTEAPQKAAPKAKEPEKERVHRPMSKVLSEYVRPPAEDELLSSKAKALHTKFAAANGKSLYTLPSASGSVSSVAAAGLMKVSPDGVVIPSAMSKSVRTPRDRKHPLKLYATRGRGMPGVVVGNGTYVPPAVPLSEQAESETPKQGKPLMLHLSKFLKRGRKVEYNQL